MVFLFWVGFLFFGGGGMHVVLVGLGFRLF